LTHGRLGIGSSRYARIGGGDGSIP